METRDNCLRRIRRWRTPPNYSAVDWIEEIKALCSAAAWQGVCEFDPKRGVPLSAFVYQRVMARALARYRQEWAYGARFPCEGNKAALQTSEAATVLTRSDDALCAALSRLGEADRSLLKQLFWEESTEADLAEEMGLSQQAVNKRKQAALRNLRRALG
jgi:RNA polymerase sigma factor (sigma-70 family)